MYILKVKVFRRHFENDNYYHIEEVLVSDEQLGKWLKVPKNLSREIISYRHC